MSSITLSNARILVTGGSGFIGTNLLELLSATGATLLNADWNPSLDPGQQVPWREVDLMDGSGIHAVLQEFQPTHIVHLAARTDTDEKKDLDAYIQNHEGTRRLLRAARACPSLQRIIVTSTQFVCEAGYQPANDMDFKPFTVYGESKRLTELATREASLNCAWTIIRPTTIWGPWSLRYRDVMLKVMRKGLYFHPSGRKVIRSYGYVGNVCWQIQRMLEAPVELVNGRVFYVGDPPLDLRTWVDAVSMELTGRPSRVVPDLLVRTLALGGDALKAVGLPFPITSGRYRSMTQDYITPMDKTSEALGQAPFDLRSGVREFIRWYREDSLRARPLAKRIVLIDRSVS
ncbi:MAG: NAD(P)-dependent oxidoreductase [Flavobacteriales bacterium]|nr:NAD(P)-dependent oxidoreductase [Flavobacteriales bacterium]